MSIPGGWEDFFLYMKIQELKCFNLVNPVSPRILSLFAPNLLKGKENIEKAYQLLKSLGSGTTHIEYTRVLLVRSSHIATTDWGEKKP